MDQTNNANDLLNDDDNTLPARSSTLNVLTILTIIGCVLGAIFAACTSLFYDFALDMMDKAVASGKDLSPKKIADMDKARAAIELGKHNLIPLVIIAFTGIILCFIGALLMRKLKKDGFWLYIAGEIIPVIGTFILLGPSQYSGIFSILIGLGLPLLFIILYTQQKKFLVY